MILSGAALAQVSRPTEGKDVPYANMTPSNGVTANDATPSDPARNDTAGNDQAPGAADQKTEPATPRR